MRARGTPLLAQLDLKPAAPARVSALSHLSCVAHIKFPPDKRKGMRAAFATHRLAFFDGLDTPIERMTTDNSP